MRATDIVLYSKDRRMNLPDQNVVKLSPDYKRWEIQDSALNLEGEADNKISLSI